MVRKTDATDRRAYIHKLLKRSGFAGFPLCKDLAAKFGVSRQQIHHDFHKVLQDIGADNAKMTQTKFEDFATRAINRLNKDLENCHNPRDRALLIREIRLTLAQEAEMRIKLGILPTVETEKMLEGPIEIIIKGRKPLRKKDVKLVSEA